jgi:hypothetical protein
MSRWRRGALVGVALLTATSCGSAKQGGVVQQAGFTLLVAPKALNEVGVGFTSSRLSLVDGCVGLDFDGQQSVVAIWPHGSTLVSTSPLAIDVPGLGRVEAGDELAGGGANYQGPHPMPGVDVPASCSQDGLVSFTPDR